MAGVIRRLVPYVPGWWWAIGVDLGTVVRFVSWHLVLVLVMTAAIGVKFTIIAWVLGWAIPCLVVLPILRFIGEIEEHQYPVVTLLDSTNTNMGFFQSAILHPHGDGYHTLHHIYPTIPFFRIARAHRALIKVDPNNYGRRVPVRTKTLQEIRGRAI